VTVVFRILLAGSMIRFIRTARWIRTARITSRLIARFDRLFDRTFDLFLDDFQNFFNLITDFIFVFRIDFELIRKQFRFKFVECECFKLDFEAVWSLVRFISKELCQFFWCLAWSWWLNWWLIIILSRLLSCLFVSCFLRKLLCYWQSCRICSET